MKTIAVMQPYFFPYAGYYRLLASADVFVAFDCVQFPRRGWVHRNRFTLPDGQADWLTLPLAKAPRDTRIDAMTFVPDAEAEMARRLSRFPALAAAQEREPLVAQAGACRGKLADYLVAQIEAVRDRLDLPAEVMRSSTLDLPTHLAGQDRILTIVRRLGGTCYVNAPGGRALYDPSVFAASGVALKFLDPYDGPMASLLQRVVDEPDAAVRSEIFRQSTLAD